MEFNVDLQVDSMVNTSVQGVTTINVREVKGRIQCPLKDSWMVVTYYWIIIDFLKVNFWNWFLVNDKSIYSTYRTKYNLFYQQSLGLIRFDSCNYCDVYVGIKTAFFAVQFPCRFCLCLMCIFSCRFPRFCKRFLVKMMSNFAMWIW